MFGAAGPVRRIMHHRRVCVCVIEDHLSGSLSGLFTLSLQRCCSLTAAAVQHRSCKVCRCGLHHSAL